MRKNTKPAKPNPDSVPVVIAPGEDSRARIAQTYLRPTVQSACTVRAYNKSKDGEGPEIGALVAELGDPQAAALDRELEVLHVAVVLLEQPGDADELAVATRHGLL